MAKYDHGGGCACGLQYECDCRQDSRCKPEYTIKYLIAKLKEKEKVFLEAKRELDLFTNKYYKTLKKINPGS